MTALMDTLEHMVAERPARARVFEEAGIDYCCDGEQTLAEACRRYHVDAERILGRLTEVDSDAETAARNWSDITLGELCDSITSTYHASLKQELPRIGMLLYRVTEGHAERHRELNRVLELFSHVSGDMKLHMTKEEESLFPRIKEMEGDFDIECELEGAIEVLELEHETALQMLDEIRELTHDYRPPADACGTYRAVLDALQNLEHNLREHLGVENNVLFPRVFQMQFVGAV